MLRNAARVQNRSSHFYNVISRNSRSQIKRWAACLADVSKQSSPQRRAPRAPRWGLALKRAGAGASDPDVFFSPLRPSPGPSSVVLFLKNGGLEPAGCLQGSTLHRVLSVSGRAGGGTLHMCTYRHRLVGGVSRVRYRTDHNLKSSFGGENPPRFRQGPLSLGRLACLKRGPRRPRRISGQPSPCAASSCCIAPVRIGRHEAHWRAGGQGGGRRWPPPPSSPYTPHARGVGHCFGFV